MGISEKIEPTTIATDETTSLPNPRDWNDDRIAIPIKADDVGCAIGAYYKQKISEK